MVPIKGTFEWISCTALVQSTTGTRTFLDYSAVLISGSGFNYVPIDKLLLGVSFTEYNLTWKDMQICIAQTNTRSDQYQLALLIMAIFL
jgi:hypothetical protein